MRPAGSPWKLGPEGGGDDFPTSDLRPPRGCEADRSSDQPCVTVPLVNTRLTTGAAYVDAVEAQANAQREAASQRILDMVKRQDQGV